MIKIIIPGAPVTKKNSQRILKNFKTGKPFIAPSEVYERYEQAAGAHLYPKPQYPLDGAYGAFNLRCVYYMPTHRRVDLANLLEATTDVLVKHRILADDNSNIVGGHDGSRVLYDKSHPRVEIEITEMRDG